MHNFRFCLTLCCLKDPEKGFEVKAGSLAFSVTLYTICAIMAIGLLVLRRFLPVFGKAELGGNRGKR